MMLVQRQTAAQRRCRKPSQILPVQTRRDECQLQKGETVATSVLIPLLLCHPIVQAPQVSLREKEEAVSM